MEIKKLIGNIGIDLCPYIVVLYISLLTLINAEDYYELLGIQQSATTKEIRQAFKKLAVTMHPDKNLVSTSVPGTSIHYYIIFIGVLHVASTHNTTDLYDSNQNPTLITYMSV